MRLIRCAAIVTLAAGLSGAPPDWQTAERNASDAQRAVRLCKRLARAWLDQADEKTGLLPRNLDRDRYWNARDAAADNHPFYLLTAFVTDDYHLKRATLDMLAAEKRHASRLDRLPDDFLFATQSFRAPEPNLDGMIFGAAEYAKDGLIPITEWLGPGPWLDRMVELVEDIWKHAPYDSTFGKLPSKVLEVNGDLLQVTSRMYWLTREERYRDWAFRLADYYLFEEDILRSGRLQLDDHSCEIIGGLAEAYFVAAHTDPARRERYRPRIHAILDRVLRYGRNEDGLLYHTVDPATGKVLNADLTDNWGYNYNAFLTVAGLDGEAAYREAVTKVLGNIHKYLDFRWENAGADGYADSIEGGINLLNRMPVESAWGWVDASMAILLAKQRSSGIMEGWHGDGNTARTALMWALAKTQGVTAAPWREDVELGAGRSSTGGVRVLLKARYPWKGRLRFDRPRHRDHFRMPADYPRINQFPEWFTAEENGRYRLSVDGAPGRPVTGRELWNLELTLPAAGTARVEVEAAP